MSECIVLCASSARSGIGAGTAKEIKSLLGLTCSHYYSHVMNILIFDVVALYCSLYLASLDYTYYYLLLYTLYI